MRRFGLFIISSAIAVAQSWTPQVSLPTVSLRGVFAVSPTAAWASGAGGTFLRTTDSGVTWTHGVVTGSADGDFRAIYAFSDKSAYLLSSGAGPLSRLYRTDDGGIHWNLTMVNPDPKGFWDGIAMWDDKHGILLGDPVNGRFDLWTTSDGSTWKHEKKGPQAEKGESSFAASNSSLIVRGAHDAWFVTGGEGGARVFHSDDDGRTWSATKTPLRHASDSAGIFSIAFADARHGVIVGGDFKQPGDSQASAAYTSDGGKTWTLATAPPGGYRSAVAYLESERMWIAVGTSGSDVSSDDGKTWKPFDTAAYNALSFSGNAGWAVGPKGAVARFVSGH